MRSSSSSARGMGKRNPKGKSAVVPSSSRWDRLLAVGGITVSIALFVIPHTPATVIGALVLIFLLWVHPIWNWLGPPMWSRILALVALTLFLAALGWFSWPTPAAINAVPDLRIEPEHDLLGSSNGMFTLSLVNYGPDVDHAHTELDYFTAQKDSAGDIRIKRMFHFEEGTSPVVLRTNQTLPIAVDFRGFVIKGYQSAKATFSGLSLLGVRITVIFRRFSDQKEFTIVRAYEVTEADRQGIWTLSPPSTSYLPSLPEFRNIRFTIDEVMPYIQSLDRWSDMVVTFTDRKPVTAH